MRSRTGRRSDATGFVAAKRSFAYLVLKVIFLGTSGGMPTTRRNLPSVCLLREGEMILFDCGEGTQTRIMKKGLGFGRLTKIIISHIHGDHLSGLVGILMTLSLLEHASSLSIYGPKQVNDFIYSLRKNLRLHCNFTINFNELMEGEIIQEPDYRIICKKTQHSVPCFCFSLEENIRPGRFNLQKAKEMGIPEGPLYSKLQRGENIELQDGRIVHSEEILGPSRRGRKVVYITDTLFMENNVEFANNADLLIHEGMFALNMQDEAKIRMHSTSVDAAIIANAANVKRLVITHISPRYQDISELRNEARQIFPSAIVAHDLLEIEIPYED